MPIQYNLFFRQFGVRRVSQLIAPPMPTIERLELPKDSIFHYTGNGLLDDGPKTDEFLFRNITRPILLTNVTSIGDNKGTPRRLPIPIDPLIRSYHIKNRRYRKLFGLDNIPKDPMTMIVVNYAFIPRLYRYMRSIYSEYYRWHNQQASLWKTMDQIATTSDRNQFVVMSLPERLPSLSELRLGGREINQRIVKLFKDPNSLFILEFWKWLGENRSESVFSHVKRENYGKINIILQESSRFFVINLKVLDSWRAATKEELLAYADANEKGFGSDQLQKRFLRLLISAIGIRSSIDLPENLGDVENVTPTELTEAVSEDKSSTLNNAVASPNAIQQNFQTSPVDSTISDANVDVNEVDMDARDLEENFDEDDAIDKELVELEKIAQLSEVELDTKATDIDLTVDDEDDTFSQPDPEKELEKQLTSSLVTDTKLLEDALMRQCDLRAEEGLMSASQYKRFSELSKSYRAIVSPDGKTTLDKFIAISDDELKIPEDITIPDSATVFDKTMLKSSLLKFDEYYTKNILQKDVASMVMNIQRAGIAITDYEVNHASSITGDADEYTIKVSPVEGAPSTLRFKLPSVKADGTWVAGGSHYSSRAQRIDVPIRKINPSRVALTSYYGKTFISRSSKKVNDYGAWIRDSVFRLNLDKESNVVENLQSSVEFDNTFMCPRVYSILAMQYKSFDLTPAQYPRVLGAKTFHLNFDYKKRLALYGEKNIKSYEVDGSIIIGAEGTSGLLVLDANNAFYYVKAFHVNDTSESTPNRLIAMGQIEELLGLDISRAPIDFTEVKVLGREIPVGVVLGYDLGLDKLIKLLKLTPRRVPVGQRVNLIPNEYALVFNDETLVFSRDDSYASLIMAGFNAYHKTLREFNVHEFNEKAVYLNLIESAGLSHRYLREIDCLYQLFIDPITRDLLIQMKEPTTFRKLLLRSTELLKYDQHPDEMDGRYMRIRGYERFAGAVYTELTRSIRAHSARAGRARLPIDLNPYQVWIAVTSDRAKVQISEINPIENLKQQEAVTYTGAGGRTSRTMVKRNRIFHENDKGVISESTVDSSDTGVNVFMPANPLFTSVRGLTRHYNPKKDGFTSLVSTSAMLSPSATKDDKQLGSY